MLYINFLYQQFPLNAVPLKIGDKRGESEGRPALIICRSYEHASLITSAVVQSICKDMHGDERVCVISLGDIEDTLVKDLTLNGLSVTKLESFDDVEQLSYRKRSVVISPWQFIGGTQFSHVVVLATGISAQTSQFGRLREMISVYLSCSRAADTLKIVCADYIPQVLAEASDQGFLQKQEQR